MTCEEAEVLLHALIDGELDAGHARDVENHGYRRQLLVHIHDSWRLQVFLFAAPAYDGDGQG